MENQTNKPLKLGAFMLLPLQKMLITSDELFELFHTLHLYKEALLNKDTIALFDELLVLKIDDYIDYLAFLMDSEGYQNTEEQAFFEEFEIRMGDCLMVAEILADTSETNSSNMKIVFSRSLGVLRIIPNIESFISSTLYQQFYVIPEKKAQILQPIGYLTNLILA